MRTPLSMDYWTPCVIGQDVLSRFAFETGLAAYSKLRG